MTTLEPTAQLGRMSRRVLVVEDEFYIAEDLAIALSAAGLEVVGPTYSVSEALREVKCAEIDGAIVDINVKNELAFPVADALVSCGVPFVMITGYDAQHLEPKYRDFDRFPKPFDPTKVIAKLQEKMASKKV